MARNKIMHLRTANANGAARTVTFAHRRRRARGHSPPDRLRRAVAARRSSWNATAPRSSRSWVTVHPARSSYSRAGSECRCPPIKSSRRTTPAATPRSDSEECASPAWQAGVSSSCVSATCTRWTSSRQIAATRCGWSPSGSHRSSHTVNSCGPPSLASHNPSGFCWRIDLLNRNAAPDDILTTLRRRPNIFGAGLWVGRGRQWGPNHGRTCRKRHNSRAFLGHLSRVLFSGCVISDALDRRRSMTLGW